MTLEAEYRLETLETVLAEFIMQTNRSLNHMERDTAIFKEEMQHRDEEYKAAQQRRDEEWTKEKKQMNREWDQK